MQDEFDEKRRQSELKLIKKMEPFLKDYEDDELLSILSKTVGMYQQSNNENFYFTALGTFLFLMQIRDPDTDTQATAQNLYFDLCKVAQKYQKDGSKPLQN